MWSNRLALQHGDATYNDLDEILFEIATRAEPRDLFLLGASSRVGDYCDQTCERLIGKADSYAFRDKSIRPWHVKKDQDTLDAEFDGRISTSKYYMDDDEMKRIVLMIANSDRILHNITTMPAIFNDFRDSFKMGSGVLRLKDNADICTAAEVARTEFSGAIEPDHPLWGTLDSSVVVTEVDADVVGTHVSGASGSMTTADSDMSSDLNEQSI